MIKTLKRIIAASLLFGVLAVPALAAPSSATAAVGGSAADSLNSGGLCEDNSSISGCLSGGVTSTDPEADNSLSASERVTSIAQQVIRIFSYVVGIISVIMVIVGGFQYVTSGGDSGKVTTAKNTIMYALIGIIIVALSQIMVNFVLERFTN